jgi:probable F420-dependent oxidoreductase
VRFSVTHPLIAHPYDPGLASGAGIASVARAAEAAGFSGFGFTDHPAPSRRWLDGGGHDAVDPFVALGFAAAHTTSLRLLPNIVVLPYRNPFLVAKAGATLDRLSGGRFTLAVGAGYLKSEFAALGVAYEERNELFDEALELIHLAWTGDEVTFDGRHFSARQVATHPRPVAEPRPPIWIGGNSAAARQRVADHAEGWCPFPAPAVLARTARTVAMDTFDALAAGMEDLRRRLEAAGRDPEGVDVCFAAPRRGDPAEHLGALEDLAGIGVTWVQVSVPGDSVQHAIEAVERYGEEVIGAHP